MDFVWVQIEVNLVIVFFTLFGLKQKPKLTKPIIPRKPKRTL